MNVIAYIDESYSKIHGYYLGCLIIRPKDVSLAYEIVRNAYESFLKFYGRRYDRSELKFSDLLYEIRGLVDEKLLESKLIMPTLLKISQLAEIKAINTDSEVIMYFMRDRYRFKKDILRRVIAIKIMLIDSKCNIIVLEKGVFSKYRQLLSAMKVLNFYSLQICFLIIGN